METYERADEGEVLINRRRYDIAIEKVSNAGHKVTS
jgi:hypothetical protein